MGQAVEETTEFCNALRMSHFRNVSKGETAKHRNVPNIETVETMVRKRRMKWLGHIAKMDAGCRPRNCWYAGWKWASDQL